MKLLKMFIKCLLIAIWIIMSVAASVLVINMNDRGTSVINGKTVIVADKAYGKYFNKNDVIIVENVPEEKMERGIEVFYYDADIKDGIVVKYGIINRVFGELSTKEYIISDKLYYEDDRFEYDRVLYKNIISTGDGAKILKGYGLLLRPLLSSKGLLLFIILPAGLLLFYEIFLVAKRRD